MGKAIAFVVVLISAVLIIIAAKTLFLGPNSVPTPTAPIERAKATQCLNNIRNLRGSVNLYSAEKAGLPNQLEDLEGASPFCPVTNAHYVYDNSTGKVSCPAHPRY